MHVGKNWPVLSVHYCGWDKTCQLASGRLVFDDGTVLEVPPNRRINIGLGRHHWWINITQWSDRGHHSRDKDDYRRLRRGETR